VRYFTAADLVDTLYRGLADNTVPTLAQPTDTQRRAFQLLGATIPLTLQ